MDSWQYGFEKAAHFGLDNEEGLASAVTAL